MGLSGLAMARLRGFAMLVLFAALSLMTMEAQSTEVTDIGEATSLYTQDVSDSGEYGGMLLGEDKEISAEDMCKCKEAAFLELGEGSSKDGDDESEDKDDEKKVEKSDDNDEDDESEDEKKKDQKKQLKNDLTDAQGVLRGTKKRLAKEEAKVKKMVGELPAAGTEQEAAELRSRIKDANNEASNVRKKLWQVQAQVAAIEVKVNYADKVERLDKSLKDAVDANSRSEENLAKAKDALAKAKAKLSESKNEAEKKNSETALADATKAVAKASKESENTKSIEARKKQALAALSKDAKKDAKKAQGGKKLDCQRVCAKAAEKQKQEQDKLEQQLKEQE